MHDVVKTEMNSKFHKVVLLEAEKKTEYNELIEQRFQDQRQQVV